MQEILVRGTPPDFCRIRVKVDPDHDGPQTKAVREGFYQLARPNTPSDLLLQNPLSPAEREVALDAIWDSGSEGCPVQRTSVALLWMSPQAKGFGQRYARVSTQLSLREDNGRNFPPLCTIADCFSVSATETSEEDPKCFKHKGDVVGFAVLEYGLNDGTGNLTQVGHMIMTYKYDPPLRDRHFKIRLYHRKRPPGNKLRWELLNTEEDAKKMYTVWQTTRFLQCLANPSLKYSTKTIFFGNGLEGAVKDELERIGLRLQGTAFPNHENVPYPFGRRTTLEERPEDNVNEETGVLYVCCDSEIVYGGQSVVERPFIQKVETHCSVIYYDR